MEHLLNSLSSLRFSEKKPSSRSRDLAARALSFCWRHEVLPLRISASVSGGVFFSFWNGKTYGDMEISEKGKISLMFGTYDGKGSVFLESSSPPSVDQAVPFVGERLGFMKPFV